nr:hypothetical protein [Brucella intermedia]
MAIFDRLDRAVSRTVDRTYAIRFEGHPQASNPNGRSGPDPQREVWLGKGVLVESPQYDSIEIGKRDRAGNDLRAIHAGQSIKLSVDKNRYPQAASARQRDRIRLDDLRVFEVVTTKPDGMTRVVFVLVELK